MDWPEIPLNGGLSFYATQGGTGGGSGGHSNAMRRDRGITFEGTAPPPPSRGRGLLS